MKKQIENILSNTPTPKQPTCPNPKIPIIVDTREKQSLIAANLVEQKANIKFEKLEIGDYLINGTIIERKTFNDLASSITDKRLFNQLKEIKKYSTSFLIIEGFYYNYNKFNIHENAIRGTLLSIANDFQVPIVYTENEEDTAKFLILLAKKSEKPKQENPIRQTKTFKTTEEEKQFILEGFPSIGPTKAKELLKKFPNLKTIFNSSEEELSKIIDKKSIENLSRVLNS